MTARHLVGLGSVVLLAAFVAVALALSIAAEMRAKKEAK